MTDISFYNNGGLYVPLCQDDVISLPIYIVVKCLLTVAKISHIVYHFALAGNNICFRHAVL